MKKGYGIKDVSWSEEYLKRSESDQKRHKAWCKFYSYGICRNKKCYNYSLKCKSASRCDYYEIRDNIIFAPPNGRKAEFEIITLKYCEGMLPEYVGKKYFKFEEKLFGWITTWIYVEYREDITKEELIKEYCDKYNQEVISCADLARRYNELHKDNKGLGW